MPTPAPLRAARVRRIRRRLLLPALAVGVSLAGLAVLRALQSRDTQIELARANTLAIARSSAQSLDATIAGTRTLLFGLRELTSLRLSRAVNDSILKRINEGSTIPFADMRIIDTSGGLLGASHFQNRGPPPPGMLQRPIFRRARESRDFTIGPVRRATTLPGQPLLLSFVLPVIDSASQAITSFVTAAILVDSLKPVQMIRGLPAGSVLTLVDALGMVTYRSLDTDQWLGRPYPPDSGVRRGPGLHVGEAKESEDGTRRVVGTERLTEAPWMLYLGTPVEPTLRIARRGLRADLLAGALLVLLVLALCYRAAIKIVGPIESLTTDVRAIADGDMTRRSLLATPDELGELGRALNRMADTIVDRTDALRRSHEQLLHAQKMEALGHLAGGIAHDFNNYLHVIGAHAEMARLTAPPESEEARDLDQVLSAAERAATLTRQILVFSRKQVVEPSVVDLNVAITGIARLLHRVAGDDRVLTIAVAPESLPVVVDAGEFEQVLMNLVGNARDATESSGTICVSTRMVPDIPSPGSSALHRAEVLVSDDGAGMSRSVRERIFDPFFTTKQRGHGTGLGLAIVYSIVNQAGGSIDVESAPGSGTTFRIMFPISGDAAELTTAPRRSAASERGDGVVLVVDDDIDVLYSTRRMLEVAGYRVIAVMSGSEALATLAREPGIDLLLTDVMMPEMTGPALAASARRKNHDLPVLFMTGYADDETALHTIGAHREHCIRKPFSAADLSAALGQTLGRVSVP